MARVVGDYMFGRQIGSGSFSVVWLARHRIRGTEVAVKEIVMERLSKKLRESLLSEIVILKKISHPNIIALHDIIEVSGRIYLVLEYCRGGDLSMYIQRHGRVPEATAKFFMQQLATGLQVLRENNLIHRDLKPQNLLLTSYDDNSILKIADFGFARSLQPRGLAETLCGSPLYMAPEIMQLQKYDAKADLWSVGAILFQLVIGRTPFTGINQIQLLQNIIKSIDLRFPSDNNLSSDCIDLCRKLLRRNPVERLTFEEFFNHPFLAQQQPDESLSCTSSDTRDAFPLVEGSPSIPSRESSQEDCLPFVLDDEPSGQDGCSSALKCRGSIKSTYGFSVNNKVDKSPLCSPSKNLGILSRFSSFPKKPENTSYGRDSYRLLSRNAKEITASRKDSSIADSLEFVDQEYVLVPGPPLDMSSSSVSALGPPNSPGKLDDLPIALRKSNSLSAPVPITGRAVGNVYDVGSLENRSSPASGTSQGSMDTIEQPSTNCMTRIRSLQQGASVITELVREEVENGRRLEAFSIQLVILAIWKQALHICHAEAASAIEGSPSQEARTQEGNKAGPGSYNSSDSPLSDAICLQIESCFLAEVGHAEELAKEMGQVDETTEMPDAIEMIFQSALTLGRHGAVDEMMGNTERAAARYSKSACLLHFLLVEASCLVLNPPVSLTNSDRYRLRTYIDIISNRHGQSMSQRMALLKCEDQ